MPSFTSAMSQALKDTSGPSPRHEAGQVVELGERRAELLAGAWWYSTRQSPSYQASVSVALPYPSPTRIASATDNRSRLASMIRNPELLSRCVSPVFTHILP